MRAESGVVVENKEGIEYGSKNKTKTERGRDKKIWTAAEAEITNAAEELKKSN